MRFDFAVSGTAAPKGSAKAFRHAQTGQVIVHADNRAALKAWERDVRTAALRVPGRQPLEGPVMLTAAFFVVRPASVSPRTRPHPIVKPDLSKLLRGIEDALTGVLYRDDAQIVRVTCSKHYCTPDETPGVRISLSPVEGGR